jgi:hypothetical protein
MPQAIISIISQPKVLQLTKQAQLQNFLGMHQTLLHLDQFDHQCIVGCHYSVQIKSRKLIVYDGLRHE